MRIIVGFDGSAAARDALGLARALSAELGASLTVASAIEFGPEMILGPSGPRGYDEARAAHHARVFELAREELDPLPWEPCELQDTAAHGLTDLAERTGADLVVIGSAHRGPIGRVFAGSVATKLLQGSPCPVAVAPRGWAERPFEGLARVGLGYDDSAEARAALDFATGVAGAVGARLRLITVAPYIGAGAEAQGAAIEALRERWGEALSAGAAAVPDSIEVERVLREGREASELAHETRDLDLLIVGSRGYGPIRRTLIGSVATELVRTAECPLIVVSRGGGEADGAADAAATATPPA